VHGLGDPEMRRGSGRLATWIFGGGAGSSTESEAMAGRVPVPRVAGIGALARRTDIWVPERVPAWTSAPPAHEAPSPHVPRVAVSTDEHGPGPVRRRPRTGALSFPPSALTAATPGRLDAGAPVGSAAARALPTTRGDTA
jgi:hypothetical protein